MSDEFGPDWVTSGWSRMPNTGEWVEMGASAGVTMNPSPMPPELSIHNVARKLNELEAENKRLRKFCAPLEVTQVATAEVCPRCKGAGSITIPDSSTESFIIKICPQCKGKRTV
jgi:hypothetical protein